MLVHKSVDVRPEIWRKLRINAELSGVSLRDYLTWVIDSSVPADDDPTAVSDLQRICERNRTAKNSDS